VKPEKSAIKYIDELYEKFNMRNAKTMFMPIKSNVKTSKEIYLQIEDKKNEMDKRPYKKLVGSLIYLANAS